MRVDPGAIGRLDKGLGWYPLVFTRMAAWKAQDDITDLFAGRVYGEIVRKNASRVAMRRLLAKRRRRTTEPQREAAFARG